jgi:hypothetical protein
MSPHPRVHPRVDAFTDVAVEVVTLFGEHGDVAGERVQEVQYWSAVYISSQT